MHTFKITIAIIILSFSTMLTCQENVADEYASVGFMIGDVTLNNIDATVGMIVNQNDIIKTGRNAFCDIRIGK